MMYTRQQVKEAIKNGVINVEYVVRSRVTAANISVEFDLNGFSNYYEGLGMAMWSTKDREVYQKKMQHFYRLVKNANAWVDIFQKDREKGHYREQKMAFHIANNYYKLAHHVWKEAYRFSFREEIGRDIAFGRALQDVLDQFMDDQVDHAAEIDGQNSEAEFVSSWQQAMQRINEMEESDKNNDRAAAPYLEISSGQKAKNMVQ